MLNIVFVGDTKNYHSGCYEVCKNIKHSLKKHTIVKSFPPMHSLPDVDWDAVDLVLVNGEGTLHHNRPAAEGIMDFVKRAQSHGVNTAIVNTVWQNMHIKWKPVLDSLDYFSVRDQLSQEYVADAFDIQVDCYLDISMQNCYPLHKDSHADDIVCGNTLESKIFGLGNIISIFDHEWEDFVYQLSRHKGYVSGRFHEIAAACVARTPFWPIRGNSWKIQGLLYTADSNITVFDYPPKNLTQARDFFITHKSSFDHLFDFVQHKEKLDINKVINNCSRTTS